jgi:hypothetical protein
MPDYDPIYLTINQRPAAILRGMQEVLARREQESTLLARRRRIPRRLFLAGFLFFAIDLFFIFGLGYTVLAFSAVGLALWAAALVLGISLARGRRKSISPRYTTVSEVIHTLRDDLEPERNFAGHLDLTGVRKPEKLARETPNALGLAVQYYRDEWLRLKARLYDGNILRVSAVQREKVRKGYHKRSRISGKNKWKPPKDKGSLQELTVKIAVNPAVYEIVPIPDLQIGAAIGPYLVNQLDTRGGIISLSARSGKTEVTSSEILGVLRAAYDLLQRKV